jgi:hypothetical protein
MPTKNKRTTVYLDPILLKAMRYQAILNETSVSEVINDTLRQQLAEDAEDLAAFEERRNDPLVPYDEFVKKLKLDGLI